MSNENKMLIFDFFAGTRSSTQAFEDAGHTVISFEFDKQFEVTEHVNIFMLNAENLVKKYGQPDFIWASPPCTAFSVASIGHHWAGDAKHKTPKTEYALTAQNLVAHTLKLITELNPRFGWIMENPRGILRKLLVVAPFKRHTVTYCQYGETRMKPTDLWGGGRGLDTKKSVQKWYGMPRSSTTRFSYGNSRNQRGKGSFTRSL